MQHECKTHVYLPANIPFYAYVQTDRHLTTNDVVCVDDAIVDVEHNCVVDINNNVVPESILSRFSVKNTTPPYRKKSTRYNMIDEEAVFLGGGYVFQHFGHFLLEGVNRFWGLLDTKYQNKKVVITGYKNSGIPGFAYKMLNAMGVANENIIVVHKNTKFKRVFIPPQSTNIGVYALPITKKVYNKITDALYDKTIQTYDKIYMSRGAINDNKLFGEKQIEKIFAKNGYKIIYPEKLPIEHQITLVNNCKILAGVAGSALHLAFFMKPGGTVIQIKRNSLVGDNVYNQQMINSACELNTIFIGGSIETFPTSHFTKAPQIIGVTPQMMQFFNDYGFKYTKQDVQIDKTEFNKYLYRVRMYKLYALYEKIIAVPIRLLAALGITKHGRMYIGNLLRRIAHI